MIAYLDTSSLFKLYHQEEDSESVESIISGVELMHLKDEECTFITSDDKLKELFQAENLNVAL